MVKVVSLSKYRIPGYEYNINYNLLFENLNILYTYIPKVGCTTLKRSLINKNNGKIKLENREVHKYVNDHFILSCDHNTEKVIKFIVFRNPFDRFVSGYIDKVLRNDPIAQPYIKLIIERKKTKILPSFFEFVDYIYNSKKLLLNDHFLQQSKFIYFNEYDYVFDLLNINNSWMATPLSFIPLENDFEHSITHERKIIDDNDMNIFKDIYNWDGARIRDLVYNHAKVPQYKNFFLDTDLKYMFHEIYKNDILLYNELFTKQTI